MPRKPTTAAVAKPEKHKFISWGAGAIGQLDNDKDLDVKCEYIALHPKLGPFKLPEVRIDNVDINLPTDKVFSAVSAIADAALKQMPLVKKIPFAEKTLAFFKGE